MGTQFFDLWPPGLQCPASRLSFTVAKTEFTQLAAKCLGCLDLGEANIILVRFWP
jgi:hypothetical protein